MLERVNEEFKRRSHVIWTVPRTRRAAFG